MNEQTRYGYDGFTGTEASAPDVLVCDLERDILKGDLKAELFWAGIGARGIGHLVDPVRSWIAVEHLPYNRSRIAALTGFRAAGMRLVLVSDMPAPVLRRIAAYLGVFDEVHGDVPKRHRAAFLDATFGASAHREVDCKTPPPNTSDRARHLLRAMRPHQWAKNGLIFLPLLAGHALGGVTFLQALVAFVAFSLVASSVYVLNDLLDLAADRAHPRKRARPFASGALPLRVGTWLAPGLLGAGIVLAALLGPVFLGVLALYYVTTTLYSFWLKEKPVVDIFTLAGLYTLRIFAGGVATGIPLSVWLLAFSLFFFFALAAVKRQAELVDSIGAEREIARRGYRPDDLPLIAMMALASGYVSVMVLALYVNSPEVSVLYQTPQWLWGMCAVVLYWVSRIVFITHRGRMHDDPLVFAARDRVSQMLFLVTLGFFVMGSGM